MKPANTKNTLSDKTRTEDEESDHKESNASLLGRIERWYQRLPDKKKYLEFFTALLTIPVLLTVIISNVQNLQKQNQNASSSQTSLSPTPEQESRPPKEPRDTPFVSVTTTSTPTPTPSPSLQCKREIGPISILYPEEGTLVSKDPVCLDISRTGEDYCAVVWSYRINESNWSDYTDKSICIYGLTGGVKKLELRVKSIVTGDETILTRTFTVAGSTTPTPTSTSSAALQ